MDIAYDRTRTSSDEGVFITERSALDLSNPMESTMAYTAEMSSGKNARPDRHASVLRKIEVYVEFQVYFQIHKTNE